MYSSKLNAAALKGDTGWQLLEVEVVGHDKPNVLHKKLGCLGVDAWARRLVADAREKSADTMKALEAVLNETMLMMFEYKRWGGVVLIECALDCFVSFQRIVSTFT
jgi:hypothetical protein